MKEVEDHDVLFVLPKCLNGFEIEFSRDETATILGVQPVKNFQTRQCPPFKLALTYLGWTDCGVF